MSKSPRVWSPSDQRSVVGGEYTVAGIPPEAVAIGCADTPLVEGIPVHEYETGEQIEDIGVATVEERSILALRLVIDEMSHDGRDPETRSSSIELVGIVILFDHHFERLWDKHRSSHDWPPWVGLSMFTKACSIGLSQVPAITYPQVCLTSDV